MQPKPAMPHICGSTDGLDQRRRHRRIDRIAAARENLRARLDGFRLRRSKPSPPTYAFSPLSHPILVQVPREQVDLARGLAHRVTDLVQSSLQPDNGKFELIAVRIYRLEFQRG